MTFGALAEGEGDTVLCLHGFPDNLHSFRHQLPVLAAGGHRVLALGLRGYEPATQPGLGIDHYHPVRVAEDVIEWAQTLGPVHLIGHDWGGIVGYLAAASRPDLFRSLTTLAVPHFSAMRERSALRLLPAQIRKSWYVLFFQLRGLADWVVERNDFAFIERLWRDWSPGFAWEPEAMVSVKRTFRQPGVLLAALSYYRAMLAPRSQGAKRMDELMTRPIEVPTLAITGAQDGCLDTRLFDHVPKRLFPAGLKTERIEDAGHFLHQEDPDAVNALLLEWLAAKT
jgi:pimeloyl-ACP methyl ester carboxylesterase